jgi:hypothetical protein
MALTKLSSFLRPPLLLRLADDSREALSLPPPRLLPPPLLRELLPLLLRSAAGELAQASTAKEACACVRV